MQKIEYVIKYLDKDDYGKEKWFDYHFFFEKRVDAQNQLNLLKKTCPHRISKVMKRITTITEEDCE